MTSELEFTGVLPAPELASALADTEVVILPDSGGPSSRRGVVAAALAQAQPIVAVDGPERWQALVDSGGVAVAAPSAGGLAGAVGELVRSESRRQMVGARAAEFYARRMAPGVLATEFRAVLDGDLAGAGAGGERTR
jgi:glycosyltransferase involved in cell wall biosynthesis